MKYREGEIMKGQRLSIRFSIGFGEAALVFLMAAICISTPVAAATLTVGERGISSVKSAVQAASPGDTIIVAAGFYQENLFINKPLTLIGEPGAHISGLHQGCVVSILADDVTVSGFEVSGSGNRMMTSDAGINVLGTRAKIRNNQIMDNLFGVYLRGCSDALVEGNTIEGREADEIGQRGAGVHFYDATGNVVRNNSISNVRDGVYFDHSDFNKVERNEFSNLRYGVHYMYCKKNSFYGNVFRNSMGGVAVMYTEGVTFRDNQIFNNRNGYNAFGLLLKDCLDSVAENNVIINNVNGIFLDNSHGNRFEKNLVAYNDVGVVLHANSLGNSFGGNDFIGNLATLHTVGKAKADWTPGGKGNYYSDYNGYDLDGDGLGDTPYRLQDAFEYLAGNRPRLRLFLSSAAADALAAAESSFPLVPTSDQRDEAPRMKPASGAKMEFRPASSGESNLFFMFSGCSLLAFGACCWLSWRLMA